MRTTSPSSLSKTLHFRGASPGAPAVPAYPAPRRGCTEFQASDRGHRHCLRASWCPPRSGPKPGLEGAAGRGADVTAGAPTSRALGGAARDPAQIERFSREVLDGYRVPGVVCRGPRERGASEAGLGTPVPPPSARSLTRGSSGASSIPRVPFPGQRIPQVGKGRRRAPPSAAPEGGCRGGCRGTAGSRWGGRGSRLLALCAGPQRWGDLGRSASTPAACRCSGDANAAPSPARTTGGHVGPSRCAGPRECEIGIGTQEEGAQVGAAGWCAPGCAKEEMLAAG